MSYLEVAVSDADAKDKPRTVVMDKSKGEPVISVQGEEKKEGEKPEDQVKKEGEEVVKTETEEGKPAEGGEHVFIGTLRQFLTQM